MTVSASKPLRGRHCSRIQAFSSWGSIRQELQQLAFGLVPRNGDCLILSGLSFTREAEDSSWFWEAGLRDREVRVFLNLLTFCINCTANQYHVHLHKNNFKCFVPLLHLSQLRGKNKAPYVRKGAITMEYHVCVTPGQVTKQPTPGIVSEKECSFILFENIIAHFRRHWEQIRTQVFLNRPKRLKIPFLSVLSLRDLAHSFGIGEPVLKGGHRNVFIHHIYLPLCQHSSERWVSIFLMEGRATRTKVPGAYNNHNVAWSLSLFVASEIASSVKSFKWMELPQCLPSLSSPPSLPGHTKNLSSRPA